MTAMGILNQLTRQVRRLASAFREKPAVVLDDYLLEHFMFYHGLVGTSPENQPQFRDVRADIADALKHRSSSEMAIALKLPPLWWEEKLAAIFTELRPKYEESMCECLLPAHGIELPLPDSDPLRHPDWRVRANAARIIAHLGLTDAIPRMVAALQDSNDEQRASFAYIAYALARLQTEESRAALIEQLSHEEPWFRVDAAGALACWPLELIAPVVLPAVLQVNPFADYRAVAICRSHRPARLLAVDDAESREGALEVIIGLVEASSGPLAQEVFSDMQLHECLDPVVQLAREQPSPRRLRAALALARWVGQFGNEIKIADRAADCGDLNRAAAAALAEFGDARFADSLLQWLRDRHEDLQQGAQLRHASKLAGYYGLRDAVPFLLQLATPRSPALDAAIEALGEIGDASAVPHLVNLIDQLVDLEERTARTASKQPVFEDNPAASRSYWHILRALSRLPAADSAECLLRASHDFAADKRQQALSSLVAVGNSGQLAEPMVARVASRVVEALHDPSPSVRVSALQGVGGLRLSGVLTDVVRLANARETSVWRQAAQTVRQLHADGYKAEVERALSDGVVGERDHFKRQRLQNLLMSLKS